MMADNTEHRLLSTRKKKACPTIWLMPRLWRRTMCESSGMTVLLSLNCFY